MAIQRGVRATHQNQEIGLHVAHSLQKLLQWLVAEVIGRREGASSDHDRELPRNRAIASDTRLWQRLWLVDRRGEEAVAVGVRALERHDLARQEREVRHRGAGHEGPCGRVGVHRVESEFAAFGGLLEHDAADDHHLVLQIVVAREWPRQPVHTQYLAGELLHSSVVCYSRQWLAMILWECALMRATTFEALERRVGHEAIGRREGIESVGVELDGTHGRSIDCWQLTMKAERRLPTVQSSSSLRFGDRVGGIGRSLARRTSWWVMEEESSLAVEQRARAREHAWVRRR